MSENSVDFDVAIVGGGAAGFFAAINIAVEKPDASIVILERGNEVLSKVRISGGGRCNVTHAEFVPGELVKNYPRGEKELKGPFHTFCTGDTISFFEERGVALKIEEDGRMFPVTDTSETIINCFLQEANKYGIKIYKGFPVKNFTYSNHQWQIKGLHTNVNAQKIVICTGSNPKIWGLLQKKGHTIVKPVPSLFTFNCNDPRIKGLAGISTFATVTIKFNQAKPSGTMPFLEAEGPLLITHWGMSGPAILKLSAWGARALAACKYQFSITINWLPDLTFENCLALLEKERLNNSRKTVHKNKPFDLPKRLWVSLANACKIHSEKRWAELSNKDLQKMATQLTNGEFAIHGKSTFKEEFVTAGGIELKEVDFKTYQSKKLPNLYFAGEVLNIDAITGGFNFQNAWTGAYIAAKAIAKALNN